MNRKEKEIKRLLNLSVKLAKKLKKQKGFDAVITFSILAVIPSQIAIIVSQQEIPMIPGGIVKDKNHGEIVNLPDGTQVIPNNLTKEIGQGHKCRCNYRVYFDGKIINDKNKT